MPSKAEEYLALAQRTANGLTRYWESWTDYLTTASRLYKYTFADQLMIYAQRPDATAVCTTFSMCRIPGCAAIPVTRRCGSSTTT